MKLMLYLEYVHNGSGIQSQLTNKEITIDSLSPDDKLSLHSHQFSEYWLTTKRMKDISFMVKQFPWMSSDGRNASS